MGWLADRQLGCCPIERSSALKQPCLALKLPWLDLSLCHNPSLPSQRYTIETILQFYDMPSPKVVTACHATEQSQRRTPISVLNRNKDDIRKREFGKERKFRDGCPYWSWTATTALLDIHLFGKHREDQGCQARVDMGHSPSRPTWHIWASDHHITLGETMHPLCSFIFFFGLYLRL